MPEKPPTSQPLSAQSNRETVTSVGSQAPKDSKTIKTRRTSMRIDKRRGSGVLSPSERGARACVRTVSQTHGACSVSLSHRAGPVLGCSLHSTHCYPPAPRQRTRETSLPVRYRVRLDPSLCVSAPVSKPARSGRPITTPIRTLYPEEVHVQSIRLCNTSWREAGLGQSRYLR
ncbi:hypothetical protein SKAU_G00177420 [Synaphobranchus kaupii]|uniref:Uncharacterized protein n=1 Tax=Synaphobranchus kaupii TaxID=118154 RepID=A0A9Q1J1G1_SYNKA|nr:hypothetical protein SKAU_G00177420 [Synaphobranchus kaupii]